MEDPVAGLSSTSSAGQLSRRNRFLVPTTLQTELAGESADILRSLFDQMALIHQKMEQMQRSQDERERPLRDFIHKELQGLKSSLQGLKTSLIVESQSPKAREFEDVREEPLRDIIRQELVQSQSLRRDIIRQELQVLVPSMAPIPLPLNGGSGIQGIQKGLDRHANQLQEIVKMLTTLSSSPDNFGLRQEASKIAEVVEAEEGKDERCSPASIEPVFQDTTHNGEDPKFWSEFQEEIEHADETCVYQEVLRTKLKQRSFWHDVFDYLGIGRFIYQEEPTSWAVHLTKHSAFTACQTILILTNTAIMGYETDVSIKAALQEPQGEVPNWLKPCNLVFNIIFAVELLFRLVALGSWFWVCPADWGWNFFDFFLVLSSLISDILDGVNFSFIRTFRVLRAVRAARLIRMLKVFRQLRQMLFSILAALSSLMWAFAFMAMVMFMFSILFLQGSLSMLEQNSDEYVTGITREWWGSLAGAMFSLLVAVTGGKEWVEVRAPLEYAGHLYSAAFVGYMLFVTVGVMNVLTGVFLSSASDFLDLDLIVQNEQVKVDQFCEQMMDLFFHMDVSQTGLIDWQTFDKALQTDRVRHFVASLKLEPTHVKLIFDLLDIDRSGKISIDEFLMGMVRLKGEAKAVDARIIQRELGMMPKLFKRLWKEQLSKNQAI